MSLSLIFIIYYARKAKYIKYATNLYTPILLISI